MTEHPNRSLAALALGRGPRTSESAAAPAESTGVTSVDGVLESLIVLDDLPVTEHVAVFEQAHEALRTALGEVSADRSLPSPHEPVAD